MRSPLLTGLSGVAASARLLTHPGVRSLTCSTSPWTGLAIAGDRLE